MKYNISCKETIYNGVKFRSRLEARWAAMFDIMKWQWIYEPFEIKNYNPDFIITGNPYNILIEVKPAFLIDVEFKKNIFNKIIDVPNHLLILDELPFFVENNKMIIGIGSQYFGLDKENNRNRGEIEEIFCKYVYDISSFTYMWNGWIFNETERRK